MMYFTNIYKKSYPLYWKFQRSTYPLGQCISRKDFCNKERSFSCNCYGKIGMCRMYLECGQFKGQMPEGHPAAAVKYRPFSGHSSEMDPF